MIDRIDGALFQRMIVHASASISAQKQSINELNVFPVPDGDTGTNMSLTIGTAAAEARKKPARAIGEAASINASALLRGARGNSGVILSLLFRGVGKSLKEKETADGREIAAALKEGVAAAYKAVMKPTEGTILTVSRLCADAAEKTAQEANSVEAVLEAAIDAGEVALAATTDQNPVLKKAGVVDAGGKGFLIILQGMLYELRGIPAPVYSEDAAPAREGADFAALGEEEITFTFDTVFIVRKKAEDVDLDPFRVYLNGIGDSLVIGEDDASFKVHVHTDIPGAALTEAQKYGELELAKIENMRTQYEDMAAGRTPQSTDDLERIEAELEAQGEDGGRTIAPPEKKYGVVAVCAGQGLAGLFKDLGVDGVISGGQTMNPSTEDILRQIDRTPAEIVFVLPNNKNIIMAAQQCEKLCEGKRVVVIPTKTVPQGVSSMLVLDGEAGEEDNTRAMTEAAKSVSTTEITYAARDSDFDGFEIHAGDYMALTEGQLFGIEQDLTALLEKLAMARPQQEASFINLYYGQDVAQEDADKALEIFQRKCPNAEVVMLSGGQPVYYYMISAE